MPYLQTEHIKHDQTCLPQIKHTFFSQVFMTFMAVHCQHVSMSILVISWQRRATQVKCMAYSVDCNSKSPFPPWNDLSHLISKIVNIWVGKKLKKNPSTQTNTTKHLPGRCQNLLRITCSKMTFQHSVKQQLSLLVQYLAPGTRLTFFLIQQVKHNTLEEQQEKKRSY